MFVFIVRTWCKNLKHHHQQIFQKNIRKNSQIFFLFSVKFFIFIIQLFDCNYYKTLVKTMVPNRFGKKTYVKDVYKLNSSFSFASTMKNFMYRPF